MMVRSLLLAGALAILALPAPASASTDPEPSPSPCALGTSTLEAGAPLTLSGTRSTDEPVGVMARRADGEFREPAVVTIDQTWRSVLVFGAGDGGLWTVEVNVDGVSCVSRLTVTLPAGVVASPAPGAEPLSDTPEGGLDTASLGDAAILSAVVLVIASWVFLAVLALVRATGRHVMVRRPVRAVAQVAAFVAILGAGMAAWAITDLMVGISHFDSEVPPDQQAALSVGFWVVLVLGSLLGTLAALKVQNSAPAGETLA